MVVIPPPDKSDRNVIERCFERLSPRGEPRALVAAEARRLSIDPATPRRSAPRSGVGGALSLALVEKRHMLGLRACHTYAVLWSPTERGDAMNPVLDEAGPAPSLRAASPLERHRDPESRDLESNDANRSSARSKMLRDSGDFQLRAAG